MHLSPGETDDGDAEQQAVEDVGEADPDAANEEPQHIQERAQALGANAIVGIDIDYETIGANGSMLMVATSGTAVVI